MCLTDSPQGPLLRLSDILLFLFIMKTISSMWYFRNMYRVLGDLRYLWHWQSVCSRALSCQHILHKFSRQSWRAASSKWILEKYKFLSWWKICEGRVCQFWYFCCWLKFSNLKYINPISSKTPEMFLLEVWASTDLSNLTHPGSHSKSAITFQTCLNNFGSGLNLNSNSKYFSSQNLLQKFAVL